MAGGGSPGATTIAVVGSVNLDLVVEADRLPAPGETVLGSDVAYRPGGKGANQAVAARRFGAATHLFAAVGDDDFGTRLRAGLGAHGVDVEAVRVVAGRPSGVALIVVDPSGQNTITVAAGANAGLGADELDGFDDVLGRAAAVVLQLEIPLDTALAAARRAVAAGVPVTLNASPLPGGDAPQVRELLGLADVLVVNETEAAALDPRAGSWEQRGRNLLEHGPRVVVITLGAAGAVAVTAEEAVVQPAFAVDVVDATGAGDTFCAVLAVGLAEGASLADAVRDACAAGALAATRIGPQDGAPSAAEVRELVAGSGR